jgi:outer membrane receptor protein involved in Fe transport
VHIRKLNLKMALMGSSVLIAALGATTAFAQVSPPPAPAAPASTPTSTLDEVVVTATPNAGGLKKLDAAFSTVAVSGEQLKEAGLTATADVLKASPGVFIESSGGPGGGANVEIAGFPSNSFAPFATFQLNGASLFPNAGQNYMEGSVLLRPDDTLKRVELVQGGPEVLYGDGQPGLTANYILRRGTDTPTGDFGITYGSEGYERIDGFYGFAINKDAGLYGSVGGYWNQGNGVRNPQFIADQGGQVTATLSKEWSKGSLMVYGRYLNFDDEFVTDTPVIYGGANGVSSAYPGFSPLTGTMSSKANQFLNIPFSPTTNPGGNPGSIAINQADGRGAIAATFGGEFHWDFGHGIQVSDDFNVTQGQTHMSPLYSSPVNPESLQAFISAKTPAAIASGITSINAYYTNTGAAVPLTQSVMQAEVRYLMEKFHSESNELHVSWEIFPGNTVTVGNRTAWFGVDEQFDRGADILLQAQNNPAPIGINLTSGGNTYQLSNTQGFTNGLTAISADKGEGMDTAFFLTDTWKWNKFLFDAGVRTENSTFHDNVQNTATANLTGNPLDLWGTGKYLVPGSTRFPYNATGTSWTVGLDYEITPQMSAYVRANHGVRFLAFSDVINLPQGNYGPLSTADNYQVGYRYQNSYIYADVSAFKRTFANVPVSIPGIPLPGTTVTGTGTIVYGSTSTGLLYQVTLSPFRGTDHFDGLTLSASGNFAWAKYTQDDGCIFYTGGVTPVTFCVPSQNINGHWLARQPVFQTRVTPAYKTTTPWGPVKAWANFEYVGDRYGDMLGAQFLAPYYDLSAGVTGTIGEHWEWTLQGTNLTNQIGITEFNPRVAFGSGAPAPGPQLARSIEGREVNLQIKYNW